MKRLRHLVFLAVVLWTGSAGGALVGCDYWDRVELSDVERRLDLARQRYRSIADPTKEELAAEYRLMWKYWQERGYDPRQQMGDEAWLRRVYKGRIYRERIRFVPTHEEFWLFCLDTRLRTPACKQIHSQAGQLSFDRAGTAINSPASFLSLYQAEKDKFFEHTLLAAIIVDSLPSCDGSANPSALVGKANRYLREQISDR